MSERSAILIYQWFRDVCSTWLLAQPIRLGGPGVVVQIDESLYRHKPKASDFTAKCSVYVFTWLSAIRYITTCHSISLLCSIIVEVATLNEIWVLGMVDTSHTGIRLHGNSAQPHSCYLIAHYPGSSATRHHCPFISMGSIPTGPVAAKRGNAWYC